MYNQLVIIGDIAIEKIIIDNWDYTSIGGSGFYSQIGAMAFGNKDSILISNVGFDFDFKLLKSIDFNISVIKIIKDFQTTKFITTYDNNGNRKFMIEFNDIINNFYYVQDKYLNARIIFLSGSNPQKQLKYIEYLKQNHFSGIIASDVFEKYCEENPIETLELIQQSDICFMNENERGILNFNPQKTIDKTIIVKNGEKGAICYSNNSLFSVTPNRITNAIDTNGAGDILAGSFLSGVLSGDNYSESLKKAVNIATSSVSEKGVLHILGVKDV